MTASIESINSALLKAQYYLVNHCYNPRKTGSMLIFAKLLFLLDGNVIFRFASCSETVQFLQVNKSNLRK